MCGPSIPKEETIVVWSSAITYENSLAYLIQLVAQIDGIDKVTLQIREHDDLVITRNKKCPIEIDP